MNTYLEIILRQKEPLDGGEIAALEEWLTVLREDCGIFGETPEDTRRIATIEARVKRERERKPK